MAHGYLGFAEYLLINHKNSFFNINLKHFINPLILLQKWSQRQICILLDISHYISILKFCTLIISYTVFYSNIQLKYNFLLSNKVYSVTYLRNGNIVPKSNFEIIFYFFSMVQKKYDKNHDKRHLICILLSVNLNFSVQAQLFDFKAIFFFKTNLLTILHCFFGSPKFFHFGLITTIR